MEKFKSIIVLQVMQGIMKKIGKMHPRIDVADPHSYMKRKVYGFAREEFERILLPVNTADTNSQLSERIKTGTWLDGISDILVEFLPFCNPKDLFAADDNDRLIRVNMITWNKAEESIIFFPVSMDMCRQVAELILEKEKQFMYMENDQFAELFSACVSTWTDLKEISPADIYKPSDVLFDRILEDWLLRQYFDKIRYVATDGDGKIRNREKYTAVLHPLSAEAGGFSIIYMDEDGADTVYKKTFLKEERGLFASTYARGVEMVDKGRNQLESAMDAVPRTIRAAFDRASTIRGRRGHILDGLTSELVTSIRKSVRAAAGSPDIDVEIFPLDAPENTCRFFYTVTYNGTVLRKDTFSCVDC